MATDENPQDGRYLRAPVDWRPRGRLFVPPGVANDVEMQEREDERLIRKAEVRAVRLQALTAVAAVLLAIPGLVVAYTTFVSQQDTAQRQNEAWDRENERYSRRYESRVSWWIEYADHAARRDLLHIENRAPVALVMPVIVARARVPIGSQVVPYPVDANLTNSEFEAGYILPNIRPCSSLVVDIYNFPEVKFVMFSDSTVTWKKEDGVPGNRIGYGLGLGGGGERLPGPGATGSLWLYDPRYPEHRDVTTAPWYPLHWYADREQTQLSAADASDCGEGV